MVQTALARPRSRCGAGSEESDINDIIFARAVHVLAVVHWIGGVSMVAAVLGAHGFPF